MYIRGHPPSRVCACLVHVGFVFSNQTGHSLHVISTARVYDEFIDNMAPVADHIMMYYYGPVAHHLVKVYSGNHHFCVMKAELGALQASILPTISMNVSQPCQNIQASKQKVCYLQL